MKWCKRWISSRSSVCKHGHHPRHPRGNTTTPVFPLHRSYAALTERLFRTLQGPSCQFSKSEFRGGCFVLHVASQSLVNVVNTDGSLFAKCCLACCVVLYALL